MENKNRPAFSFVDNRRAEDDECHYGLTKREYFAAKAMQKLVDFGSYDIKEEVIRRSIAFADELLKQLEKS